MDDNDPEANTPLQRAQQRVAFALAEKQLQGNRELRAEIRQDMIGRWIAAKAHATGEQLQNVVKDAAKEFDVGERTAWKAWKRRRSIVAK